MKYILLLLFVSFFLIGHTQYHNNLTYNAVTTASDCCYGDMLGYSVWNVDTVNGQPVYRHDSLQFYYDQDNRVKKASLYYQPHQDSAFKLKEEVRVAHENDSSLTYETRIGKGSVPPGQPADSIHYKYFSNGEVKEYKLHQYQNGEWVPTNMTRYFALPNGVNTAYKLFSNFGSGLEPSGYTKIYNNRFNQDSVHITYTINNTNKEVIGKTRYTYDQNGYNDTLTNYNYIDSSQSFVPTGRFIWPRRLNGEYEIYMYQEYESIMGIWIAYYMSDFIYENGLNTKVIDYYRNPAKDTLEIYQYNYYSHNATGQRIRTRIYEVNNSGDTVLTTDVRELYHQNGYPDSTIYYERGVNQATFNLKYSKYYYSNISSTKQLENKALEIKLYPNPADNFITLQLNSRPTANIIYHVYSMDGRRIDKGMIVGMGSKHQLALPETPGTYLYHFNIDGRPVTKKVIRK